MYLVTAGEMQQMDRQTIESFGIPGRVLMENAGRGATDILLDHFPEIKRKKAGVIAGRGNNGGDGFVIARYLKQKGVDVTVYLLAESLKVTGDAAANLKLLTPISVPVIELPDETLFSAHQTDIAQHDILIDAILGTGLKSEVKGYFKIVIDFINALNRHVFSVDIPSGLDSDTGQPCGTCIRACVTATFAFAKIGHILFPGAEYTGKLEIIDIGIPPYIADNIAPKQHLMTQDFIKALFCPRPPDAHKGHTGHLFIIAGSPGKTGAAAMTAMSAMRAGAGLVTLGVPKTLNPVLETQILEAMTVGLPETSNGFFDESAFEPIMEHINGKRCLAVGPGIGTEDATKRLIHRLIRQSTVPLVIDADGLNCLAGHTEILKERKSPIILTPHPGEMARLIEKTTRDIQNDRINCARDFASRFNVHLVLKGAKTVIAHPDRQVFVNPTGNAGMASGGMGDVLTGIIAGFITQGYSPEAATHLGVYLHGATADSLAEKIGHIGYIASDVINSLPKEIRKLAE